MDIMAVLLDFSSKLGNIFLLQDRPSYTQHTVFKRRQTSSFRIGGAQALEGAVSPHKAIDTRTVVTNGRLLCLFQRRRLNDCYYSPL